MAAVKLHFFVMIIAYSAVLCLMYWRIFRPFVNKNVTGTPSPRVTLWYCVRGAHFRLKSNKLEDIDTYSRCS